MEELWKRVAEGKENIRFCQAPSYSPYCEFSDSGIEEIQGLTRLSMNAFYRYAPIMEPLFASKELNREQRDWLFDVYMHYLTELEYRKGATRQELAIRKLQAGLTDGIYGERVKAAYLLLDRNQKYYVSHMLECQQRTRESVNKCADVLVTVLQDGIVYKSETNEKQLMLYINKRENEQDKAIIHMVCELFLPLGYDLRVFWENHFAVIGEMQTMVLDEIELL